MGLSIQTGDSSPEPDNIQDSSLTSQEGSNEQIQESVPEQQVDEPSGEVVNGQDEQQQAQEATSSDYDDSEVVDLTDDVVVDYLKQTRGLSDFSLEDITSPRQYRNDSVSYSSSEVEAIDKFVRETGRDPYQYYAMQSMNVEGMDDVDVVRAYLKQVDPELSPEEIEADIEVRYKLDGEDGGYSDKEVLAAKAQLKRDARQARSEFNNLKETFLQPVENRNDYQGLSETEMQAIRANISRGGDSIGEIEFGDKVSWNFGITDDARQNAIESVSNMTPEQLMMYTDESGRVDYQTAVGSEMLLQNIEQIAEGIWNAAQDAMREDFVKNRKNINVPEQTGAAPAENKSEREMIIDQLKNHTKKSGLRIQTG